MNDEKFFKFIPVNPNDGIKFANISKKLVEENKLLMMVYHNITFPSGIEDIVEASITDPEFVDWLKKFAVLYEEEISKKQRILAAINRELMQHYFDLSH